MIFGAASSSVRWRVLVIPVEAANTSVAGHIVYSTHLDASLAGMESPVYGNETEAGVLPRRPRIRFAL